MTYDIIERTIKRKFSEYERFKFLKDSIIFNNNKNIVIFFNNHLIVKKEEEFSFLIREIDFLFVNKIKLLKFMSAEKKGQYSQFNIDINSKQGKECIIINFYGDYVIFLEIFRLLRIDVQTLNSINK